MSDSYLEFDNELDSLPRDEAVSIAEEANEHVIDLEKVTYHTHNWVDRGEKWSCETQTHECHQVWKRR